MNTPRSAATKAARTPTLPAGSDETVAGFGVMGLPFASGHYLAFRDFPAASFLPDSVPGYRSVWHRGPDGGWTFYATTSAEYSCARYMSAATANDAVVCPVETTWTDDYTLDIAIPGILSWSVELQDTAATRVLTSVATRLPDTLWTSASALAAIGRFAGAVLGAGQVRLAGTMPNGQYFRIAPQQMWAVRTSRARLFGHDLGAVAPLPEQARLGDFRAPQRGLAVVGQGRFDAFDPTRHRTASDLAR
ncbi:hypothetical protein [Mycobacterium sp. SMC-4]|uniref:hypothetical protein n=1 Tax=Mycobacterium sp. SMC-4 TaxID=2857059 RepID=UPI0021B2435F|nr:hypothetical protein [Mycobacterium sp. SMC-4]UXA19068.1 hypothetical protein KXD98_05260 [Mycobacterium sp. SMC-4]